jgi:hypothetical protein
MPVNCPYFKINKEIESELKLNYEDIVVNENKIHE